MSIINNDTGTVTFAVSSIETNGLTIIAAIEGNLYFAEYYIRLELQVVEYMIKIVD